MLRTLTERERDVLVAMLTHAQANDGDASAERRRRWLEQVPGTRVAGTCECGTCPSIELVDAAGRAPDAEGERIVLEVGLIDGTALVLLFIDEDRPSYLELAPFAERAFAHFPPVSELSISD